MIYRCNLYYSLLLEGLFRYNAHFIITLFSLGSHYEHYNEVAVYKYMQVYTSKFTVFASFLFLTRLFKQLACIFSSCTFQYLQQPDLVNCDACYFLPSFISQLFILRICCDVTVSKAMSLPSGSSLPPPGKRKEIYKYEAPWTVYSMNWSVRPDKRFRLALGSFMEEYNNKVSYLC